MLNAALILHQPRQPASLALILDTILVRLVKASGQVTTWVKNNKRMRSLLWVLKKAEKLYDAIKTDSLLSTQ